MILKGFLPIQAPSLPLIPIMNSLKCPSCSVINWSSTELCIKCKSPLTAATSTISQTSETSPAPARRGFTGELWLLVGLGVLLLFATVYSLTRSEAPLKKPDKAPPEPVVATAEPQKDQAWKHAESPSVDTFGVPPFSDFLGASMHAQVSDQTIDIQYGTQMNGDHWQGSADETKTICTTNLYSKKVNKVNYALYQDTVYALVTFDIDSDCKGSLGRVVAERAVRQTEVRYEWNKGMSIWRFCDQACFAKKWEELHKLEEKWQGGKDAAKEAKRIEYEEEKERKERIERELQQLRKSK
jgi:hypothetical protein